ncbi:MAG: hypothetical protein ACYSW8_25140 [Planctomycetota bacterium]|jgi:hypothetical protein
MTVEEMKQAFMRDRDRRYEGVHSYHFTPEEAQALLPVEPIEPARYDKIGICEVCGEDYDKTKHSQKYCSPECRLEVKREYDLRRWHDVGDGLRKERKRHDKETVENDADYDPAFASEHFAFNILAAIALQAHEDGDEEARDDLLEMIGGLPNG